MTVPRYTFVCTLAEKENDEVFGTGGEILRSLQRLMGHLAGLRDIELVDLLLERVEGMHALDQVRPVGGGVLGGEGRAALRRRWEYSDQWS